MKEIRRITLTVTHRRTVRQQWLPVSAICPACGCKVELQVEMPDTQVQTAFSPLQETGPGQAASHTEVTPGSVKPDVLLDSES